MSERTRAYLFLHIAIILWGFTAILGDLISISALTLVWWRVLFSALLLLCWPRIVGEIIQTSRVWMRRYGFIGVVVGLHWLAFYGSIKLANASIALIALSTSALFTALIEPIVFKVSLDRKDILMGLLVIPAMVLISSDFDDRLMLGLLVGIISAALAAYFTVLNKLWATDASPQVITWIEMVSAWLVMSLILFGQFILGGEMDMTPTGQDVVYLCILAAGCTILPFVLHLYALRTISAFVSNLSNNLEPVYGIILAAVILHDHKELTISFYIGVVILLGIVVAYPLLIKRGKTASVPAEQ